MEITKLNKKEFIEALAGINDIKKTEAADIVNTFINTLLEVTSQGKEVQMLGEIGTKIKLVEERVYENPQDRTQQCVKPAHLKVTVKLGSKFQKAVNED